MNRKQLNLYLVTDRSLAGERDIEWIVKQAVEGGVTMVQLREKDISTAEFVSLAMRLKKALAGTGVPLLINDRIDIALASGADGVHIGQTDMPYFMARKLLGPDKIIGLSVENLTQLEIANILDVDYVAASPVFSTPTKRDTAEPLGLDGLKKFVMRSAHPVVAIGGMNFDTAGSVFDCGVDGIAVVSAIMSAESPCEASRGLKKFVRKWTDDAWLAASGIYSDILSLPFITELASGKLDVEKFKRYLAQDEIYIGNYGRQMFYFAEYIYDLDDKMTFYEFAKSGIEGEKVMHQLLIERFGINTEVMPSHITSAYNSHSQNAINTGIPALGLASLLPCMWVYNKVGQHILKTANLDSNPYREWILEYGNEEFTEGVNAVLNIVNNMAAEAGPELRERMTKEFVNAALYEFAFWDYGYRGESGSYDYLKK